MSEPRSHIREGIGQHGAENRAKDLGVFVRRLAIKQFAHQRSCRASPASERAAGAGDVAQHFGRQFVFQFLDQERSEFALHLCVGVGAELLQDE